MGSETRKTRVSSTLEEQFLRCDEVLHDAIARTSEDGSYSLTMVRTVVSLARVSAQLAGAIARLEAGPDPSRRRRTGNENSENRGSIPQ